jgi:hypothetical protein
MRTSYGPLGKQVVKFSFREFWLIITSIWLPKNLNDDDGYESLQLGEKLFMAKSVVGNSKRRICIMKSISGDVAQNIQWQWMIWWTPVVVERNTTLEEHGSTKGHLYGWKVAFSFEWWSWYLAKIVLHEYLFYHRWRSLYNHINRGYFK